MKRTKPLRRKTRLRSRGKTSYRRRPRNLDFMRRARRLPCYVKRFAFLFEENLTPCCGRIEVDHLGERAFGRKAPDDTTAAACSTHHRNRTDMTGPFKDWNKSQMRWFCDTVIAHTQREVAEMIEREVKHG